MSKKDDNKRMISLKALIIIIIIIALTILITGCSNSERFKSYHEVTAYCYNQSINDSCGVEKCIMLNSAEFNDNIKFSAEKNYYQCKLIECKT